MAKRNSERCVILESEVFGDEKMMLQWFEQEALQFQNYL